jgi:hypothetical protein
MEQRRHVYFREHMGEGITVIENTAMAQATAETNWRIERNARLHQTDRKHYVPSFIQKRVETSSPQYRRPGSRGAAFTPRRA